MIGIALEIKTDCTNCGEQLAVNALVPRIVCHRCNVANEFSPELWNSLLEDMFEEVPGLKPDEGSDSTMILGSRQFAVRYGRQQPRVPQTKKPLDLKAVLAAAGQGFIAVDGGTGRISVRRVPADYADFLGNVVCLVGEDFNLLPGAAAAPATTATPPAASGATPVTLHCYNCGAPFAVDGQERDITCEHCGTTTIIPDEVWKKLHSTQPASRWYLVYNEKADRIFDAAGLALEWDDLGDLLIDENDFLYLVCTLEGSETTVVASLAPDLTVRWVQRDVPVPFENDDSVRARLALAADDRLWLHQNGRNTIHVLSRRDGRLADKISFSKDRQKSSPRLTPKRWKSVIQDRDGSLLAYYGVDDIEYPNILNGPVRCSPEGEELAVWGTGKAKRPNFLVRFFKQSLGTVAVAFSEVGNKPDRLYDMDVQIYLAGDGSYVFVSYTRLARFQRDGRKVYYREIPECNNLTRIHLDADGTAYFVSDEKVVRLSPDGERLETLSKLTWRGGFLGEETLLARGKNGTLYLFGDDQRARVIGPDGKPVFISRKSRDDDESNKDKKDYPADDDDAAESDS
ncbi:MAG: hypothetical protein GX444_04630 [Myxococcales bacterium]|nr:hypothetical protein [Myxococcales bacterium]